MSHFKKIFIVATISFYISVYPQVAYNKEQVLPTACTTQCVAPYGEVLGVGSGNVAAYSNCNAHCVVFSPNKQAGTYTGIKWQCVEYARRWLLVNKGVVYGDVNIAADIWGLDFVTRIEDKTKFTMLTYPNGSKNKPAVGDLLIYAKAYLKTGHVSVISHIDQKLHTIKVLEQNFKNTKWPGGYARKIPYVVRQNQFWILDPYLLGWKRVTQDPVTVRH